LSIDKFPIIDTFPMTFTTELEIVIFGDWLMTIWNVDEEEVIDVGDRKYKLAFL